MTEINYRNFVIALNNPHYRPPQPPPWSKEKNKESSKITKKVQTMKIQDLLKQAKTCWKYAAYEPSEGWYLYRNKPRCGEAAWIDDKSPMSPVALYDLERIFDIEPFDGDWKDSLICREECGL